MAKIAHAIPRYSKELDGALTCSAIIIISPTMRIPKLIIKEPMTYFILIPSIDPNYFQSDNDRTMVAWCEAEFHIRRFFCCEIGLGSKVRGLLIFSSPSENYC